MVEPEIPKLRAAGAFVEFNTETGLPPQVEGVRITHAEMTDRKGYFRLYYFYPQDYPEMYHHEQVARERAFETSVKIYKLLHGEQVGSP